MFCFRWNWFQEAERFEMGRPELLVFNTLMSESLRQVITVTKRKLTSAPGPEQTFRDL
jgi:hypothetical protein